MKSLVVTAGKLVINLRQTMLGSFGVIYGINLFIIRKMLNGL